MKIICEQSAAKNGRLEPIGPIVHRVMADLEKRASRAQPSLTSEAATGKKGTMKVFPRPEPEAPRVLGSHGRG